MIEQILPDFYKLEIPLPKSPLKALNAYLIKGRGRSLIIDTGMNREICLNSMQLCLKKLNVDVNASDFFITHLHADHLGLIDDLGTETSKVYFGEVEASAVASIRRQPTERRQAFARFFHSHGFPEEELRVAVKNHPGYRYNSKSRLDFCTVKEGDTITAGDYLFKCIETPGHSPGHMCLYEPEHKILVSGDHILFDITPNITCWPEFKNALKHYLSSLEKVYPLDVNLVLPGHRRFLDNHKKRIKELKEHHQSRLDEILTALGEGDKNAWEVAPHIAWDIRASSWEAFPSVQKWFAMGETIAHLHYLEGDGKIHEIDGDGKIRYALP